MSINSFYSRTYAIKKLLDKLENVKLILKFCHSLEYIQNLDKSLGVNENRFNHEFSSYAVFM